MKKSNIPWKQSHISINIDSIDISAIIHWWSKDYFIEIISPYKKKIAGAHMMYMVPCKFVLRKPNKNQEVAILESCIEKIRNDFHENYKL